MLLAAQWLFGGPTTSPSSLSSDVVLSAIAAALDPAQQRVTPSPEDWRDRWIYFLMLDRFANPSQGPQHVPYDAPYVGFQGGTLEGIRQQLPYLRDLGVGALWITPVLKNLQYLNGVPNAGTYHGYGIQDFLSVDPRFASDPANAEGELRRLVDDAHAQGLFVIFDIVLNHSGDVFAYGQNGTSSSEAPHSDVPLPVRWRDELGNARADWTIGENIASPPPDATVFPDELRHNAFFRREGDPQSGADTLGDFASLKQMLTADHSVDDVLIRCYQYLIARYDVDGFRIDTLKYLDSDFARVFANAMREFALSIGKKNFFTFGEVYDNEQAIAHFIGRYALDAGDIVGVDAALDFPLFFRLPAVLKGFAPPSDIAQVYQVRKDTERGIVSSHGEATRFFVTFLDNHDQSQRFYYTSPATPHDYDDQLTMALACQFALPGIPSVYYGTEQGLSGHGSNSESVREALWGKQPNAFDQNHPFYQCLRRLATARSSTPALRYGRFYFRPISGDGQHFAISDIAPGILAFARILSDREVLIIANTSTTQPFIGDVIVDATLNPIGTAFTVLFSNHSAPKGPQPVRSTGPAQITEVDGSQSPGPASVIRVSLAPMEAQYLTRAAD